jgi:hypothetical protein
MWVAIHKCMEMMLGVSLNSYLYLKLAKMIHLSYYVLYFLFNKTGRGWDRFCLEWVKRREVAQTMYTHVSKCKKEKRK